MSDPYCTRFDIEDIFKFEHHYIRILPKCGKELRNLINGGKDHAKAEYPYAPWQVNDDGWLIMVNQSRRPWPDAAKNLKEVVRIFRMYDYELKGEVWWYGDNHDDFGKILVDNDAVMILRGVRIFLPPLFLTGEEGNFCLPGLRQSK